MEARFAAAASSATQLPPADLPEAAIAGRSNCGKSSLVNALTGHSRLARVSSTPGRTRELLFFAVSFPGYPEIQIVDLPGYGYARASRSAQESWAQLVEGYIDTRSTLRTLLLLLDSRRDPAEEERDLLRWAGLRQLETVVVLTKADKLRRSERRPTQERGRRELGLLRLPLLCSNREPESVLAVREALLASVLRDPTPQAPDAVSP
jgi:GTP-binding protein